MPSHFSAPLFIGGVPTYGGGGGIPATFGRVFFVDADNGQDGEGNWGQAADKAYKTVLQGYTALRTNRHDALVLSGVAAHAIADEIIVSKNRVHFIGLGGGSRYIGQRTRFEMGLTTGSAIAIIQNTGNGNTFTNIKFRSTDSLAASLFAFADGGEHTQLSFCSFEKDEDLNQAGAAEFLCNADTGYYLRCTFGNTIYEVSAARQNILLKREQITGKVARDCIWEDSIFLMKTTNTDFAALRTINANDLERLMLFKKCTFFNSKLSSANPTDVFDITVDLTDAEILLQDCTLHNIDSWAVASRGVFSNAPAGSATGGKGVEVT